MKKVTPRTGDDLLIFSQMINWSANARSVAHRKSFEKFQISFSLQTNLRNSIPT